MKTVYYLLLGLCLATAACKPDEPEVPKPEEPKDEIISGTCGENLTWSYNKTKAILTIAGMGKMEDYVIDAPWKSYKEEIQTVVIGDSVTSIGNYAFYDCSALTQVTIPDGVTSIGNSAFYNCSALTQVDIPNSVTSIGNSAFSGCSALTQITIPESVTSIEETAFNACSALTAIHVDAANTAYCSENGVMFNKNKTTLVRYPAGKPETSYNIPDGVKSIEEYALAYCEVLTQVNIGNTVTSIGNYAFYDCKALRQVNIGNSVTSIRYGAFGFCKALTQVTIGNSVTSIGYDAFSYCEALTAIHVDAANTAYCSENGVLFNKDKTTLVRYPAGKPETTYIIPGSVTTIGDDAFYYCSTLTQVTIPNSVISIEGNAFNLCRALTQITIPNSVTSIEYGAFSWCSKLTQVTIGSGVNSIGDYAFSRCSALTEMTVLATVPPTVGANAFYNVSRDIPVYVPAKSLEAYKAAEVWKEFTNLQAIQ